jgi:hypothetical protein
LAKYVYARLELRESPRCAGAWPCENCAFARSEHSGNPECFLSDLSAPYRVDAGENREEKGPKPPVDRRAGKSG